MSSSLPFTQALPHLLYKLAKAEVGLLVACTYPAATFTPQARSLFRLSDDSLRSRARDDITTGAFRVLRARMFLSGRPGRASNAHRLAGALLHSLGALIVVEVRLGETWGDGVDLDPSRL
jgi:hypothetical protein